MHRIVLVHGAATTPAIWSGVVDALTDSGWGQWVSAPARPCTGDMSAETDWLESLAHDAVVLGISGGATLVLELASRPGAGGALGLIAHEPAGGTLAPSLFPPLAAALASGGVDAFGAALYGPHWRRDPSVTDDSVSRDLAMFRGFEPAAAWPGANVLVTTGGLSPTVRHDLAAALASVHGYPIRTVQGSGHFLPHDNPTAAVELVTTMHKQG